MTDPIIEQMKNSQAAAGTAQAVDPIIEQMKAMSTQQSAQAAMAVGMTHDQAPDAAARTLALAKRYKTTPDVVAAFPKEFQERITTEQAREAMDGAPRLQSAIAKNPAIAPAVRDDISSLAEMERSLWGDIPAGVKSTGLKILGAWDKAAVSLDEALPDWMPGKMTPEERAMYADRGAYLQQRATAPDVAPRRWTGMVSGGLTYVPFLAAATPVMVGAEGSTRSQELQDKGVDKSTANKAGAIEGAIQGLINLVPMGNLVFGQGAKTLAKSTAGAAVKSSALGATQSVVSDANASMLLQSNGYGKLAQEYAPTFDKALESALFMGGFHLGMQGAHRAVGSIPLPVRKEFVQAASAEQDFATIAKLGDLAANTKLREADPETFKQMAEALTEDGHMPNVYVDAQVFAQSLDKAGIGLEELQAKMPEVAAQLREGFETGGMVRIPTADYLTHIAGGPVDAPIREHLKVDPEGKTYKEAQEFYQSAAERMKEEAAGLVKDQTERDAFKASQDEVTKRITADLNAVGKFTTDANKVQATIQSAIISRIAAHEGITPEAAWDKYGTTVMAGEGVRGGQELGQTPEFKDTTTDSYSGQTNHTLTVRTHDGHVGKLEYTEFEGRPAISMVSVPEGSRRRGLGSSLVKELQRRYPDQEIDWGMMTEDGSALRASLRHNEVPNEGVVEKLAELERVTKELAALDAKAAKFNEIKSPTEKQKQKYLEWSASVGDRWNELHDRLYDLERETAGQKPTRRVVDTSGETLAQSAYHGTPHRGIEKFSTDKIGTGEGNQAFGWGLYFAAKKDIAEFYRGALTEEPIYVDGAHISTLPDATKRIARAVAGGRDPAKEIADLQAKVDKLQERLAKLPEDSERRPQVKAEIAMAERDMAAFKDLQGKTIEKREGGQLYEVDIPEDVDMLDWDKPLSEQPEKVREAVYKSGYTADADEMTGKEIYQDTADSLAGGPETEDPQELASKLFMSLGVKGIKYLDGTSRADGEGSHNYVIFSGDDVQIKNQFYQKGDDPNATYSPKGDPARGIPPRTIALLKTANLTSYLHETGHWALDTYARIATHPDAPPAIKAEMEKVLGWFGIKGTDTVQGGAKEGEFAQAPDTEAFKNWFGKSQVVDAKGEPLVVYHGTAASGFDVFKPNVRKGEQLGFGVHFAVDESFARLYAEDSMVARKGKSPGVYATFLKAEKPLLADAVVVEGSPEYALAKKLAGSKLFSMRDESGMQTAYLQNAIDATSPQRAEKLIREAGYDAVRYVSRVGTAGVGARVTAKSQSWIVFSPEQIKSATGNRGTFDPNDPNILHQKGDDPNATYSPTTNQIAILKTANLTSYLHETGHWALDTYARIATHPDAPPAIKAEMEKVLDWFGIKGTDTVQGGAKEGVLGQAQAVRAEPTGKISPITRKPIMELFGEDGQRITTTHSYTTPEEALEKFNAPKPGAPPAPTYTLPEPELPPRSNWKQVKGREFTNLDEDDGYLYHVAPSDRVNAIRERGLAPNTGGTFGGFYANYSAGKVFLTERSGVSYWQDKVADQLAHSGSKAAVSVLRIPKDKITVKLNPDEIGSEDARAPAFYATETLAQGGPDTPKPTDLPAGRTALDVWHAMSLKEQEPYHEQFARGFEAYLMEGKAPSAELQPFFARIKSWMLAQYKALRGLNVELTDEVRGVFDRMLASEEAIAQAQAARVFEIPKTKPEGVSDAEWERWQAQHETATQDALDSMQARTLRDMKWLSNARSRALKDMQKKADAERKAITAEVEKEVDAMPLYAAEKWIKKGEMIQGDEHIQLAPEARPGAKLNTEAVREMFPEGALDRPDMEGLRGMTGPSGMHPDVMADLFGFGSGEELVRKLIDMEPREAVIEGLTDRYMLERHGEIATPEALQRAADEAVHNEARARFVATGLKILAKSPISARTLLKGAREAAAMAVAGKRVRDLNPKQYLAAETKANKAALEAIAKDPAEAVKQQRAALLNNQLVVETMQAQKDIQKALDHFEKLGKDAAQKNMRGENLDQLNELLARFDLRTSINPDKDRKPLGEWVAGEAERLSAVMPDLPEWVVNEAYRVSYKNLTVEQMRGLYDAVRQLEHLARREQKQYLAIRAMEFAEERGAILGEIRSHWADAFDADGEPKGIEKNFVPTLRESISKMGDKFAGEFLNAETIATILGGGKFGVINESLFGRLSARSDWKAERLTQIRHEMKPLFDAYSILEKRDFGTKDIGTPGGVGIALTRENALVVALLHGNADGRQRLTNYGWNEEKQRQIIGLLDKRDIALANGVWKMFDHGLWPELKALNERTRGKAPPKVEATPYEINGEQLTGGYFRLKYDTDVEERAHRLDEGAAVKELLGGGFGMSAKTNQGTSTERKDNVRMRPRLDLGVFAEAVNETVHDLAYREAVADSMRMLNDKGIQNAIKQVVGVEGYRALVTRVREVAAPPRNPAGFVEKTISIARRNTIINLMSGVKTALQNLTGLAPALAEVNAGHLGVELAKFYGPQMKDRYDFAMEQSLYMRNRFTNYDRDLQNNIKQLTVKNSLRPDESVFLGIMGFVDKGVAVPVWNAAFKQGLERFANDHDQAVQYADHVVRQTQGSGRDVDLSKIMSGHGGWGQLKKAFTMFYSYFNGQLNLLVKHGVVAKLEAQEHPQLAAAKFAAKMMAVVVVPTVLTELLMKGYQMDGESDEDQKRRWAGAFVKYGAGMFPFVRDIVPGIWAQMTGDKYFGTKLSPIDSAAEGVVRATKSVKDVFTGEADEKDAKSIIMGVGFLAGLPGKLVADTVEGTRAWLNGEAGPQAVILGPPPKP